MFDIDIKSRKSIYEQIVDGIKNDIVSGFYVPGAKLPSVRDLSSRLTVNPNTIQKAYRELESQKWIYTVSGLGCFVSENERVKDESQIEELYYQIKCLLTQLKYLGEEKAEIEDRIKSLINRGGVEND